MHSCGSGEEGTGLDMGSEVRKTWVQIPAPPSGPLWDQPFLPSKSPYVRIKKKKVPCKVILRIKYENPYKLLSV